MRLTRLSARPAWVFPAVLLIIAAAGYSGGSGLERTLFKDLPSADPAREIIRTVLASPFLSMRDGFRAGEWVADGYSDSWERARRYFPGKTYLVRPGTYFMAHGFDPEGRLFMEVHESAYLMLCVENLRTFTPGATVGAYGRMLASADGREAAAFRDKMGRLESFFRSERSRQTLRKALGGVLEMQVLAELREENYHMLAGGLMHEGMHAGMNDPLVARIQAEFRSGGRAVQWDELRAFMAEVGYHAAFCRWASKDISEGFGRIKGRLAGLEPLRKRARLRPGPEQARFEKTRARLWVEAVLIRLRMRESWQSARRMQGLLEGFGRDYIRGWPPEDIDGLCTALGRETDGLVAAEGEAIKSAELALRFLEDMLDQWSEWADGSRPFPPPVTDSRDVVSRAGEISWPDPPAGSARALMRKAREALEKERASAAEGLQVPRPFPQPGSAPVSWPE